jgi:cyclophilin family peptidyl-prolyl cis-trans isomerase
MLAFAVSYKHFSCPENSICSFAFVQVARASSNGGIIPNSASSQFFINLKDNSAALNSGNSVFGKVIDGMNVVQAIGTVETYAEGALKDRPKEDVKLIKAILLI